MDKKGKECGSKKELGENFLKNSKEKKKKFIEYLTITTLSTVVATTTTVGIMNKEDKVNLNTNTVEQKVKDSPTISEKESSSEVNNEISEEGNYIEKLAKLDDQKDAILYNINHYLLERPYSKEGLIREISNDGFSTEDIEKMIEFVDIDWQEQTRLAIEEALKDRGFSLKGLIDYLRPEGYEEEQIIEEVKKINVDWKENAYFAAKKHKENQMEGIVELERHLIESRFTYEEIKFALEKMN